MKKLSFAILIAAALLGACSLQTGGSGDGSVSMRFALAVEDGGGVLSSVRIWVYSDNVLIKNSDSQDYHSAALSGGSGAVTISDLPPGDAYRLVVAAGAASGERFVTAKYGMSSAFAVRSGVETGVSMTLSDIATAYATEIGALKSVIVEGTTIHAASGSTVYSGGSLGAVETGAASWNTATRGTIHSLSLGSNFGVPNPLVNTTNGVYAISGGAPIGGVLEAPGALQSGSYDDVFFYQGEDQFGGLVETGEDWTVIELDIDGLAGKPVMDFLVLEDGGLVYGYFATKFVGAFRMGENFIESEPDIADVLDKSSGLLSFFGEELPLIQAFGNTDDGSGTLYLGTKNGAYRTIVSFGSAAIGSEPVLVPGTRGINITKIVVSNGVVAMLSESELVVVKASKVYRMPFVTGLVGTLTDIAWQGTKVIVAGSAGIGEVETSNLGL
jgi:hypothetical protein